MKRWLLSLGLALLAVVPVGALDFGGSIDSETTVQRKDSVEVDEEATVSGWVRHAASKNLELYARGRYSYTDDTPVLFDLDAAWLRGRWDNAGGPSLFELTLGRFRAADFTSLVLDHTLDGMDLVFTYPGAVFRVLAGTSALVQKPSSEIAISRMDVADLNEDSVLFAPPRVVGSFDLQVPRVLGEQTFKLALLFQEDFRSHDLIEQGEEQSFPNRGGRLSTQYLGLGLGGPLGGGLYYDVFAYGNTGLMLSYLSDSNSITLHSYQYKPILGVLAGGGVRAFTGVLSSVIGLRALFASGDADATSATEGNTNGLATAFVPVSESDRALVFQPQLSNVMVAELSGSIKPLPGLPVQTAVRLLAFGRPSTGPITESGLDPASDAMYLGSEVDLAVNYRPFSDLGIALNGGLFFPNADAFVPDRAEARYFVGLLVSLSF